MEAPMRATVALDDELVRKAQEISGITERTTLLRMALKSLIHLEASRRLAAVGGTEPNLEEIKRVRADNLGTTKVPKEVRRAEIASSIVPSGVAPTATEMTELSIAMRRFEAAERNKAKRRGRWSVS
jgi:Arc/MetJ family transcription regulator